MDNAHRSGDIKVQWHKFPPVPKSKTIQYQKKKYNLVIVSNCGFDAEEKYQYG